MSDFCLGDSAEFEAWAEATRTGYQRKIVEALQAAMPAELVAAAKEHSRIMDDWPAAEALLAELKELGWVVGKVESDGDG